MGAALSDSEGVPRRRALWLAALVVAAAIVVRYRGYFSLDCTPIGHDWYALHQVDATHVELAAREGAPLPFWSPWILGGTPLFAVPTKPFTYPPFVLGVLALGPTAAMNVLLLLHVFLGGMGTVLLARRLGLAGLAPPVCGALFVLARFPAFGFEAAPFGFGYAVAWWPLALCAWLDVLEARRRWSAAVGFGVLVALQWHAGGEISLVWFASFAAAFAVPYLVRRRRASELARLGASVLVAAVVGAGLVAVKLLPEWSWLESSGRSAPLELEFARDSALEAARDELGHASRLATLARLTFEDFRGAGRFVLLAGALVGAAAGVRRRAWFALVLGTVLCFALASGALHEWAYEFVPGYDRIRRHTRFVHAVGFGAILLAGHGVHVWTANRFVARSRWLYLGAAAAVALLLWFDVVGPVARSAPTHGVLASERRGMLRELLEPARADPRRSRIHHDGRREQPTWIELGLESTSGVLGGPQSGNAAYTEFLGERASAASLESEARGVLDVLNVRYTASYQPLALPHLEAVAGPSDLSADASARARELRVTPFFVYRRSTARARACLVDAPTLVVGEPEQRRAAVAALLRAPTFDAATTVLVESPTADLRPGAAAGFGAVLFAGREPTHPEVVAWQLREPDGSTPVVTASGTLWTRSGAAGTTRLEPLDDARFSKTMDTIEVDVTARAAGFLLVSELLALAPGWEATVDGAPVPLHRADGLVASVRLPPDARLVRFTYRAPGFVLGAWITAATLVALGAAASVAWIRSRRRRTPLEPSPKSP